MPKTYNTAGDSTRQMASDRRKQGILWGIVAIIAVIAIFIILSNPTQFGVGGAGFLVLLIAVRVIVDQFDSYSRRQEKKIHRADRGAEAEEDIGDLLDELPDDFDVLHDVESPYGNIDHIVISRQGGIFLIETKSHRGKVTTTSSEILLNGHPTEKDFVAQALNNSYWLRDECEEVLKIKPWITSVVVFANAFVRFGKPVKGVHVINKKYLLDQLKDNARSNSMNAQIWEKREILIARLMGETPEPVEPPSQTVMLCPKCGKELVTRTVKSGAMVGREYLVCPKYPECKTAIPRD